MTTLAIPAFTLAELGTISTRPDLFQPRDVAPGLSYDPKRVSELVENFNPERFDPIAVVKDPDNARGYIVIAGHHRLEAARELRLTEVPIRVLTGDIRDQGQRERLTREAVISNYGISATNIRERVGDARKLREGGLSDEQVAKELRIKPIEARQLAWLANMPPDVIDRITLQRELAPAAWQLGRAVERYHLAPDVAQRLFGKIVEGYEKTGKLPGETTLKAHLDATGQKAAERAAQGEGMFAGMVPDAFLAQWADDLSAREAEARLSRATKRQLTACETLAAELGVDISDIQRAVGRKVDNLSPAQEAKARAILAAGQQPDVAGAGQVDVIGQQKPVDDVDQADAIGQQPAVPATSPGKAIGQVVPEQQGLGNDFATNQTLGMMISTSDAGSKATPVTKAPVKADPDQTTFLDDAPAGLTPAQKTARTRAENKAKADARYAKAAATRAANLAAAKAAVGGQPVLTPAEKGARTRAENKRKAEERAAKARVTRAAKSLAAAQYVGKAPAVVCAPVEAHACPVTYRGDSRPSAKLRGPALKLKRPKIRYR